MLHRDRLGHAERAHDRSCRCSPTGRATATKSSTGPTTSCRASVLLRGTVPVEVRSRGAYRLGRVGRSIFPASMGVKAREHADFAAFHAILPLRHAWNADPCINHKWTAHHAEVLFLRLIRGIPIPLDGLFGSSSAVLETGPGQRHKTGYAGERLFSTRHERTAVALHCEANACTMLRRD